MKSTLSSEASAALDALVMKWTEFGNDVDRALAVTAVAKLKVSSRVLAEKLGCGATHIRNYLLMAKATPKDQLLARTSEISSRELVRRSRNAVAERKATDR